MEYGWDGEKTETMTVGCGFQFDGASIPPVLRLLLAPAYVALGITKTDLHPAACIHDFLYRTQRGKDFADSIFGALLRTRADEFSGFGRLRRRLGARLAEWAVRVGGHAAYEENRAKFYG